jgi:hypothetical protein
LGQWRSRRGVAKQFVVAYASRYGVDHLPAWQSIFVWSTHTAEFLFAHDDESLILTTGRENLQPTMVSKPRLDSGIPHIHEVLVFVRVERREKFNTLINFKVQDLS